MAEFQYTGLRLKITRLRLADFETTRLRLADSKSTQLRLAGSKSTRLRLAGLKKALLRLALVGTNPSQTKHLVENNNIDNIKRQSNTGYNNII